MRRDRRDEAFNRWEVPLADLNGRLSVPEAVALSPPGGDGLEQLRGWTAPRATFDLELAHLEVFSARRSGHFGQPWEAP